jgi:CO/xanthine dehydrogenase FAD-binding subunit
MAPSDFVLHRPQTLDEACALGLKHRLNAAFLAGGTELLVDLRSGRKKFGHVISLNHLSELKTIRVQDDWLCIGSLCLLSDIAASAVVREFFPPLSEAIGTMAAVQIRNLGTMGGNFCCAVPCSDTPPISIAGGAELVLTSDKGDRTIPAEKFCLAPRVTVMDQGEILREIRIPAQPLGSGASYQRFGLRRGMALSVAATAARVDLDGGLISNAKIVMSSVGPIPMVASRAAAELTGKKPGPEIFDTAASLAAEESQPISDLRGSEGYRRHLVRVLTGRALTIAADRAQKGTA